MRKISLIPVFYLSKSRKLSLRKENIQAGNFLISVCPIFEILTIISVGTKNNFKKSIQSENKIIT